MADVITKPSRVPYASSSEEDAKDAETIEAIEADLPRIRAEAKEAAQRFESGVVRHLCKTGLLNLSRIVSVLVAARVAKRLSLDEMSQATGVPLVSLTDLEAGTLEGPTLLILQRYADVVGLKLDITAVPIAESGIEGASR